jgi:hypothetical protein
MRLLVAVTIALLASPAAAHATPSCTLIGDSIAEDLRSFFRECQASVKIGIGTKAITALVPAHTDVLVVSTGSNDYLTPGLLPRLQALRTRAGAARVIWIRPVPKIAADAVETVAHAHGDPVVPFVVSPSDREHIHPRSSKTLAADIRQHFASLLPDGRKGVFTATPPHRDPTR